MKRTGFSLVELLIWAAIITIFGALAVSIVLQRERSGKPIPGPLVIYEKSPPPALAGTVFRIDNSYQTLLSARMEMVELKLDKAERFAVQYVVCPAPVGQFKVGDRAAMKEIVFPTDELRTGSMSCRVLIKQ